MKGNRFHINVNKKLLLKLAGGVMLVLLLIIASAFIYVHLNRDKIASMIQEKLEDTFHGNVKIDKVRLSVFNDFPYFSLSLLNTTVKDSLYGENLLSMEKILLRVNVFDLIQRKINVRAVTLENGNVYLFKDTSGYSNTSLFQSLGGNKESSGGELSFIVKQFFCNNVSFLYEEHRLGKSISLTLQRVKGKVIPDEEEIDISLTGNVYVDSLMFRRGKGSYVQGKEMKLNAEMVFNKNTLELNFKPSTITIDKQQFAMSGCFILQKPLFMNLYIDNPSCNFDVAKSILTPKIQHTLSSFSIKEPLDVHVSITGESQPFIPPMVDVFVQLKNQQMQAYKLDFSNMLMQVRFTNHLYDDCLNNNANSGIFLSVNSGRMEYIPFNASVSITDLEQLYCSVDWKTRMDLTDFNMNNAFDDFYFNKGVGELQFSYLGSLSSYKDSIAVNFNDTLNGFFSIKDAVLEYPKRQLSIKDINASVRFNQELFSVECLSAVLNDNSIELSGEMSGVRRLLTSDVDKMRGDFELFSPSFDISKVLLGKNEAPVSSTPKKKSGLTFLPSLIQRIASDVTFNVDIKSNALRFRNLTAQKITGNLKLSSRGLALQNFQMSTCKGNVKVSALLDTRKKTDKLEVEAEVNGVDVKHFFRSADNFNQNAITHENLSGTLNAQAQFSAVLDNKYSPIADSMRAKIFFSLKDGELTDYAPVAEIDNFIFRKRDMKNIQFAEIRDTLLINGKEMTIMRMEVASSVVRLFVKGKYTFNGPAEIFIQVPLRNLRKPDADEAMKNFKLDEKVGASIYLKVHGTAGSLKVSLAPSGRKELKEEKEEKEEKQERRLN